MEKAFQRRIENFACKQCGYQVTGDGYTNHCPKCLWSKHVDNNPGDRRNACQGMMKPIAVEKRSQNYYLQHQCGQCGVISKIKLRETDDYDQVLRLVREASLR